MGKSPHVVCTPTAALVAAVSAVTEAGFTANVYTLAGAATAGTVHYIAVANDTI
jgi:hypothetical protein